MVGGTVVAVLVGPGVGVFWLPTVTGVAGPPGQPKLKVEPLKSEAAAPKADESVELVPPKSTYIEIEAPASTV